MPWEAVEKRAEGRTEGRTRASGTKSSRSCTTSTFRFLSRFRVALHFFATFFNDLLVQVVVIRIQNAFKEHAAG